MKTIFNKLIDTKQKMYNYFIKINVGLKDQNPCKDISSEINMVEHD